ncbi:MAG: dimethylarginine dimethylaminohydrolase family protein [Candidatus Kariarchaeaceae archaeon]|jgi:dimethylargininase
MYPKHAIVRKPGMSFPRCVSSHALRNTISIEKALTQHEQYCKTLIDLGIELIRLPPLDNFPDACFVEDTAVIHNDKVMISRMGINSRRGEEDSIEGVLKDFKQLKRIGSPATVEGGDIIHTPSHLISGVTQRTNQEGVTQLSKWLDVRVDTCKDSEIVHLKSYVTYLGNNQVLTTVNFAKHPVFDNFEKIFVSPDENYAANSLTIGNTVIIPSGNPKTRKQLEDHGYEVIFLDMSEFEKCEGALTCLSLLF